MLACHVMNIRITMLIINYNIAAVALSHMGTSDLQTEGNDLSHTPASDNISCHSIVHQL